MIEIVKKQWLDEDHVCVYDNATTHIKWPEGSLSAMLCYHLVFA